MTDESVLQPLPKGNRRMIFLLLFLLFIFSLPFLYLYATGYRLEFGSKTNLVSTGGMYVAVERTGAEIYIDNKLVRETRVFRRAFYAQDLEPGTHRVHVQKDDHHTWVKELPVSPHLVTEAQAFNLPLVPQVRIIAPFETATGSAVVSAFTLKASSTNGYVATTTKPTKLFVKNTEFTRLYELFATSTATSSETAATHTIQESKTELGSSTATSSEETATTTVTANGVKLFEDNGNVYARWIGSKEEMPYYYCAPPFPRYSTSTPETTSVGKLHIEKGGLVSNVANTDQVEFSHPVQTLPADTVCDPTIKMDRKGQTVSSFDFFPGSSDLVLEALDDGIYAVEIDNRGWQNMQPLILGDHLEMRIENGQIYMYDGTLIYQVIPES